MGRSAGSGAAQRRLTRAVHQLGLTVAASAADALGELADACGALAVSIEDAEAGSADERPVFDEPGVAAHTRWRTARVLALFEDEAHAIAAAGRLAAADPRVRVESIEAVAEHDWVRLTQAQFGPTEIGAGFWIVPSWSEVPREASRTIRVDPGLAFGTGTHPTTRLVLRRLVDVAAGQRRVLDYGCGSGILAIAAARLGAVAVDAVDVDAAALEATRGNAVRNGVAVRVGPPEIAVGTYSLVVANILATPLKLLAPLLAARVETGGELLLAGILERQEDELCAAYAPWLALEVAAGDDGWILMRGRKPAPDAAPARDGGRRMASCPDEPGDALHVVRNRVSRCPGPAQGLGRLGPLRPLRRCLQRP